MQVRDTFKFRLPKKCSNSLFVCRTSLAENTFKLNKKSLSEARDKNVYVDGPFEMKNEFTRRKQARNGNDATRRDAADEGGCEATSESPQSFAIWFRVYLHR